MEKRTHDALEHFALLVGKGPLEEGLLERRRVLDGLVDLGVDAIEQARHRAEHGRLDLLERVEQELDVLLEEGDAAADGHHARLRHSLVHVRQRQVGDVALLARLDERRVVQQEVARRDHAHDVGVREHGALGRACGAARVADGGQVARLRRYGCAHVRRAGLLEHVERHELDVELGRLAGQLVAHRVHEHDVLDAGLDFEQLQSLVHRVAHDQPQLGLCQDERDRLQAECVVQRHRDERVRVTRLLRQHPLENSIEKKNNTHVKNHHSLVITYQFVLQTPTSTRFLEKMPMLVSLEGSRPK